MKQTKADRGLCILSAEAPLEWQTHLEALRIQWSETNGVLLSRSDVLRELIHDGFRRNPPDQAALLRAQQGEQPRVVQERKVMLPKARRLVEKQAAPVAGGAENQDTSEKETSPWGFEPQKTEGKST